MSAVIRVELSRESLQIEPGQQGELSLTSQNLSEIVDKCVMGVDGVDPPGQLPISALVGRET